MVVAQLCVRTVSGFNATLTAQANACRRLLFNSLGGSLSEQLRFTTKRCRSITCKSTNYTDDYSQYLPVPANEHKRVLAERNQLREEVARKSKEIDKLTKAIHEALNNLSIVAEYPKENTSKNSSQSRKRKAESDIDFDREKKRQKCGDISATIDGYLDDE
ncbi:hypothetical protein OWV82_022503 [Melia azedarach]|uniref:Uncharacterized protein n=1 Tax=Melia azedarach TaxID=155640 RepID=A0ACC1WU76_MELAZ|nr:hypothetical protein OWV82_022503 [Melia azedarach]